MSGPSPAYHPNVRIFGSVQDLVEAVVEALTEEATRSETANKNLYVALPGGETPRLVYRRLAQEPFKTEIPWSRIHFFWGDERCVPPEHPESNFGMVSRELLTRISIPEKNVHRIIGEAPPDEEAERYGREIKRGVPIASDGIPRFDWIILGLGKDGHTASLFPKASTLLETKRLCATAIHPETGKVRITMTLPLINNAARVSFMVSGKDKSGIVLELLRPGKSMSRYPASMVIPGNGALEWLLEESAASEIQ